jgi:hypothetical protein
MTDDRPDLSGATLHFLRTEGPRGFLMRFALVYAAATLVMQAFGLWLQAPIYEIYLRAFVENDGDITAYADELSAASMQSNLGSLLMLPLSLVIWVLFEGASQRRYIRAEGFRLRIGADEGRLALVGLIWGALMIGGYFALALGAIIPGVIVGAIAGVAGGVAVGGLIFLAGIIAALWLFARLSPASALTIRDRQIRFFEAWNVTKGNGWGLTGSYFMLFLGFTVLSLVAYGVVGILGFVLIAPTLDSSAGAATADAVLATMAQPSFWGPLAFAMFMAMMVQSIFAHALGGPAAWVVRQDSLAGGTVISETFG